MARSFALIAPVRLVLQQVLCNRKTFPNAPIQKETHQNLCLGSNGVDRERSLQKILARHRGMNICINCTSLARLQQVLCNSEMVPNAPKRKEMHQNMSLGSNSVDRERSLQKILTRHRGLNFCINCSSSDHFALSLLRGTEFRFQWGGLGAFVVKTSNATLWHELLH